VNQKHRDWVLIGVVIAAGALVGLMFGFIVLVIATS